MGASTILLPFHQDERLADASIPLPESSDIERLDPALPDGDRWSRLTALYDASARRVAAGVRAGRLRAVVAGDCLAMLGTIAGLQRAEIDASVVWFDAHGDLHTMASSASGYLGGMVLRWAIGGDPELVTGPLGLRPVAEDRCLLVDGRDLDPPEVEWLATSRLRRLPVDDVDPGDLPPGPALVHVDLDVVDADELPGMRFPAGPGPSSTAVIDAVGRLYATGRVVLLSIGCAWNAPRDSAEWAARRPVVDALLQRAGAWPG